MRRYRSCINKKKTDAAITAVAAFMVFLFANNSWLTLTNRLAESGEMGLFGTGQNMVLGIQVNDMGVFLGIILGCLVAFFVNRFGNVKFHKYLAPYEGTKFSFILTIFSTIALAVIITYIWPVINAAVNATVNGMTSAGSFGFFGYGFLNRLLLPIGMHHLLWMPLHFTPMGGTTQIAGETVSGAYNIWLAQLGNIDSVVHMHPAIGFLVNFGAIAFPIAIALAFIKTAKPENKTKVKAIVFPTVILAALAGVTEPIEYLFLFTAPVLWIAHSIMFGFSFFISDVLGLKVMVGSIPETLPSLFVPLSLGRQWLIPVIGGGLAVMEYFIFKTMILKLNLPTIGRETMEEFEEAQETTIVAKDKELGLATIVKGLGGVENIEEIYNCYTRLRLDVKDENKVNIDLLKSDPSSGVVDKQKQIQIIIGIGVQELRESLEDYVTSLRVGKATVSTNNETIIQSMYPPAKGEIIPIEEVPDNVFSNKT
ncbi:PTS transporter subunit EIIC [Enterococcus mundtii]|nr:PTS transporter subunit EIIC [Enterococcus mundtii]